jgi:S-adenosylmethionine-diacylglycerol 3-amino-3-carboxypropyl transferase
MKTLPKLIDRIDHAVFGALYANSLVYNTCWEDPAVDRQALQLQPDDTLLAITSAGCNVLDYALAGVASIEAVDANPRQTALLELKLAGIHGLEYEDFFALFGRGYHSRAKALYRDALRPQLSEFARAFWDKKIGWFASPVGSFYYHGLSGVVARSFRGYLKVRPALAKAVHALLDIQNPAEQKNLYDERIRPLMWSRGMNAARRALPAAPRSPGATCRRRRRIHPRGHRICILRATGAQQLFLECLCARSLHCGLLSGISEA